MFKRRSSVALDAVIVLMRGDIPIMACHQQTIMYSFISELLLIITAN